MSTPRSLIEPLTRRELEILSLLASNCTNAEIAGQLSLALSSVKWYAGQIYSKLGVTSRREAVARARELGLLVTAASAVDQETAPSLPSGTVTFLFTDIEGSMPLWEQVPREMQASVAQHHAILRQAIETNAGQIFQIIGDEFQSAFRLAQQALHAALDAQRALQSASWVATGPLKVRMGLHTGQAELDTTGNAAYAASRTLNHTGKVRSAACGGQILLSQGTKDLVERDLPEGVSLLDLGEHRLKGVEWLEHLYQVVAPDLPSQFPPLSTGVAQKHNLPIPLTSFIGRQGEIAQVCELLAAHRLITLTGSGGVGKTRLALAVADRVLADYPNGVWYVELVQLTDPGRVAQTVAYNLGLRDEPGRPILDTLTFFLGSRQLLLVLDNCEHLLTACASLVDHLLQHCPQIRLLVASRETLGVWGERPFRVPSLVFPEVGRLPPLESLAEYEAVRLFVDRAQRVLPDFQLTAQNAPTLVQICQQLDGIPLALELAAARLSVLTTAQLAARLEDVFRLLCGGSRTALPRHQTLRAAIDWSYRLLTVRERRLFRRLSVFSGGLSLEAAEGVCAGEGVEAGEVLDLLSALVDKSMVIADRRLGAKTRYRLLEAVRQYAREKLLDAGESRILRTRHRDYYLWLAESAEPNLRNANRLEWMRCLQLEHDNLRQALEWSFHGCVDIEAGLRIASALMRFWHYLASFQEGIGWLRVGLEACADHPVPDLLHARALLAMGLFTWGWESFSLSPAVRRWYEAGLQVCQAIGPAADATRCWILIYLGAALIDSEKANGLELLEGSVAIARSLYPNGLWLQGEALWAQALAFWQLDNEELAWRCAEESNKCFRQSGDRWNLPGLWIMGRIAGRRGQVDKALHYFEEARGRFEEASDLFGIMETWVFLTGMYIDRGDYQQAVACAWEGLKLLYALGHQAGIVSSIILIASCKIRLSQQSPPGEDMLHLDRGATLLGAGKKYIESPTISMSDFYMQPFDQYHRLLEFIESRLDDPHVAQAWAAGQTMSLDQAVEFALSYSL